MSGSHAARRQGTAAWKKVLAGVLAPPAAAFVIAVSLAASALSGAFLLLLGLAAVIVRIPPRAALRAMTLGCWPAYGLIFPDWPHEVAAGAFTSGACLAALAWLRARQREQWRLTGGRMGTPRQVPLLENVPGGVPAVVRAPATPSALVRHAACVAEQIVASTERLDAIEAELAEARAHREAQDAAVGAVADLVAKAYERENIPVPGALRPAETTTPMPALRLAARDGRRIGA